MILAFFKDIFIDKYKGYKVYAHNFGKFDSTFILPYVFDYYEVKPTMMNRKMLCCKFKGKKMSLTFYDSLNILPTSLEILGKTFNVDTPKGSFDFEFVNSLSDLNYIGLGPSPYGGGVTSDWSLRKEATLYCERDVICLHQVLTAFNKLIFDQFELNVYGYLTITSLTFAIYRTLFIIENAVPQISGSIEKKIRDAYTGGSVDVYTLLSSMKREYQSKGINLLF